MKMGRLLLSLLMCITLAACSHEPGETIEQSMLGNKHIEQKQEVFSYVTANQRSLLEVAKEIVNWADSYHYFAKHGERIIAGVKERPYGKVDISDEKVVGFFEDGRIKMISFPVEDEIVVFETAGLGTVTSSITLGFYYSPEDRPVWVSSEQLRHVSNVTGEYLYYPMLKEGNGWIPDTSVLDFQKDDMLSGYGSYSERICEGFFYFESWY